MHFPALLKSFALLQDDDLSRSSSLQGFSEIKVYIFFPSGSNLQIPIVLTSTARVEIARSSKNK